MGRPVTVTVGPLATASATQVAASQKAASASYLVLNGTGGTATANSICLSQTPGGAGALTLNGALVVSGVARINTSQRIYITAAGNESARTFTVVGYNYTANGQIYSVTETITGPNASTASSAKLYYAVTSITVDAATAGALTVGNYGAASLDVARQILFTSGGNDSSITFTIAGTDVAGMPISEAVTGANASTAVTALDYKTVTSILTSGAVATTVTVGTNGVARTPWVDFDEYATQGPISVQINVSGTVNYTLQQTLDNATSTGSPYTPATMVWVDSSDTNVVAATATKQSNYAYQPAFARVTLNSGTGTITATFIQAYLS